MFIVYSYISTPFHKALYQKPELCQTKFTYNAFYLGACAKDGILLA